MTPYDVKNIEELCRTTAGALNVEYSPAMKMAAINKIGKIPRVDCEAFSIGQALAERWKRERTINAVKEVFDASL